MVLGGTTGPLLPKVAMTWLAAEYVAAECWFGPTSVSTIQSTVGPRIRGTAQGSFTDRSDRATPPPTVLALCRALSQPHNHHNTTTTPPLAVVTSDIFTQEDAEFLNRHKALSHARMVAAVETGGCPHAAIREDVSANLSALEDLTARNNNNNNNNSMLHQHQNNQNHNLPLLLCKSGGDNLAANVSRELADLTLYVIDVAGGDKVPRKGGPGITESDLPVINKIDLADAVGANLALMEQQAQAMRRYPTHNKMKNQNHQYHSQDHHHPHAHDHRPHSHEQRSPWCKKESSCGSEFQVGLEHSNIRLAAVVGCLLELARRARASVAIVGCRTNRSFSISSIG